MKTDNKQTVQRTDFPEEKFMTKDEFLEHLKRQYCDLSDNYSILQEKFGSLLKSKDEPSIAEIFLSAKEASEAILKNNIAASPRPLQIDEVAHAFFNSSRVESWEVLGEEYAGHKIGAIYSFVLGLVEKHIGESMCIKSEQIISKEEV